MDDILNVEIENKPKTGNNTPKAILWRINNIEKLRQNASRYYERKVNKNPDEYREKLNIAQKARNLKKPKTEPKKRGRPPLVKKEKEEEIKPVIKRIGRPRKNF